MCSCGLWLFYFLWSWLFLTFLFQPDFGVILPFLSFGVLSLSTCGICPCGHLPRFFLQIPLSLPDNLFIELHVSLSWALFSHSQSNILFQLLNFCTITTKFIIIRSISNEVKTLHFSFVSFLQGPLHRILLRRKKKKK